MLAVFSMRIGLQGPASGPPSGTADLPQRGAAFGQFAGVAAAIDPAAVLTLIHKHQLGFLALRSSKPKRAELLLLATSRKVISLLKHKTNTSAYGHRSYCLDDSKLMIQIEGIDGILEQEEIMKVIFFISTAQNCSVNIIKIHYLFAHSNSIRNFSLGAGVSTEFKESPSGGKTRNTKHNTKKFGNYY